MSEMLIKTAQSLLHKLDLHQVAPNPELDRAAAALATAITEHEKSQPKGWPIICIDFDGVLHSYTSGWKGADVIPDPPVAGAIGWLVSLIEHKQIIPCIYSSRSTKVAGVVAMYNWLAHAVYDWVEAKPSRYPGEDPYDVAHRLVDALKFPKQKPAAHLTIDDRGFCFEGQFPTIDEIFDFKPWYKR